MTCQSEQGGHYQRDPAPHMAMTRYFVDDHEAIADSSLDDDRNIMRPLYAEAGIEGFWIANLRDDCLEIYRGPQRDGTYRETRVLKRGQTTDIAALPGIIVAVDEVL